MKPWLSHQAQDLFLKGLALHQQNRLTEAKVLYQKALALQPKHFDALFLLGVITDDPVDSEKLLRKATQIQPAHVHALYNHGVALQDLNRIELAQTQYQKVVQLEPTHAMAHYNLGLCHFELDHLDAALRHLQKAIELEPGYVMAYNNLGATYKKMNQPDLALAAYQQALDLDPSFGLAGANMAFVNLQHARFEAGWSHYPNRHQTEDAQQIRWEARVPQWRPGQAFDRLLVVAEQGVGDEVFHGKALECFIRQHGAPACVTLDPRLVPAYQRSFPQVRFVASGALTEQDLAQVESQMALGDLMWILAMNPHVNKEVTKPHLSADAQRPALLSFLAGAERRPRVGLAWKSANPKVGAAKSMDLLTLMSGLNDISADWINLQYGQVDDELARVQAQLGVKVHAVPGLDLFNDIEGLLKLITECDFVITTSNVTAHLCGALGKPGVVLIANHKGNFWYWQVEDGTSDWYPSLKLLHAPKPGDWSVPIESAKLALRSHCG